MNRVINLLKAIGLAYWLKIRESEIANWKTQNPFARMEKGNISTVYETIRGLNARLAFDELPAARGMAKNILIKRVEEEDERDNGIS
jgi:hypothetical protein